MRIPDPGTPGLPSVEEVQAIARELYRRDTGENLDDAPPDVREEYGRQAASVSYGRLTEGS